MKKIFVLCASVLLFGCVSAEEERGAHLQLDQFLTDHCQEVGFKSGTSGYISCRAFYDGISETYMYEYSYYQVNQFRDHIIEVKNQCLSYFGGVAPKDGSAWSCIQQREELAASQTAMKKELDKQQMHMHRELEDTKIDVLETAERNRVAAATGKRPKDVTCHIHPRFGQDPEIKCK